MAAGFDEHWMNVQRVESSQGHAFLTSSNHMAAKTALVTQGQLQSLISFLGFDGVYLRAG